MLIEILSRFVIALAIGGLVGLEREIYQQQSRRGFAGIRTYLLVALLGALASYVMELGDLKYISYMLMASVVIFLVAAYIIAGIKGYEGMTTELSVMVVFVLAMLSAVPEFQKIAVIIGVILTVILSLKERLHEFARKTNQKEWYDTLTFVFMAFVILPLLPNEWYSVFGVSDAFNLYRTWLMVVFVSGVSFVGYFLVKVVGGSYGIGLAGLLGGVFSSTAATESMAVDSKKNNSLVNSYAFGAVIASVVMGGRVLFEVWVVESELLNSMVIPILVMSVVGTVIAFQWLDRDGNKSKKVDIELGSPLSLKPALMFGVLYSFVVFVSRAMMSMNIGSYGFYALGAISGLVDVDAITLSMSDLYSGGNISETVVWLTIIIAIVANAFFKILTARIFGSKEFFKKVGLALLLMAIAGIIAVVVYIL